VYFTRELATMERVVREFAEKLHRSRPLAGMKPPPSRSRWRVTVEARGPHGHVVADWRRHFWAALTRSDTAVGRATGSSNDPGPFRLSIFEAEKVACGVVQFPQSNSVCPNRSNPATSLSALLFPLWWNGS